MPGGCDFPGFGMFPAETEGLSDAALQQACSKMRAA